MTAEPIQFKIGDGATIIRWTDRNAGTIIAVSKRRVMVQRDKVTLLNGSGSGEPDALTVQVGGFAAHTEGVQRYNYERDPEAGCYVFTLRKNGRWVMQHEKMNGTRLELGRHEHYDFNF